MKINVPFFKQTNEMDCAIANLKMVLTYFGKNVSEEEIKKKTGIKEGKGLSTLQISTAASSFGLNCNFFSKNVLSDPRNSDLDFYKKNTDFDVSFSKRNLTNAKSAGVIVEERSVALNELISKFNEKNLIIVLTDWNVIASKEEKGYLGHFLTLVGFDDDFVYVHNSGFDNGSYVSIKRELFDKARKARGTDEDFVVLSKQ